MWSFLRRQGGYFLVGFVIAFVIYLMFKLDRNELITGLVIGAAAGIVLSGALFWLERRFPEKDETRDVE